MANEYFALTASAVGIVGSLAGVIIGQQMSRSWQREQWILDRRVAEFRELLDALAHSLRTALKMYPGALLDPDTQREIVASQSEAMRVIRSRIFVFDEVVRFDIEMRWGNALANHHKTGDVAKLATVFNELRVQIVTASRPVNPLPLHNRLFWRNAK